MPFATIGVAEDVIAGHFTGTLSAIGGVGLAEIAGEPYSLEGAANDYVGKGMSGGEIVGRLPQARDERARK